MFRIAILTDSDFLQAWEWECLNALLDQGSSEIVLEIRNLSPKPSGKKSPLLYRLYRALDRKLFKSGFDAFKRISIKDLSIKKLSQIQVKPIQTSYRDEFLNEDLEKIKEFEIDIILRFGFRILSGSILTVPRLGIWSYHHGDPSKYRGGPPAFWEVMLGWETTGTVLQRLTEELDQGEVLYESYSQTNPLSVERNANAVFWKSSYFVARVLQRIEQMGEEKWSQDLPESKIEKTIKSKLRRPPETFEMLSLVWNLVQRNIKRKIQEKKKPAHWELAMVNHSDASAIESSDIQWIAQKRNSSKYFADPFPVFYQGETYVFAEEFDRQSEKGMIVCGVMQNNQLVKSQAVIQEDWHLSYPFIFEQNGDFFMVPESAEAGSLFIYKALNFPFQWGKRALFFEGEGYDPTVYFANGKYWLFINQKSHPATSSFDELNLYFSESLQSANWNAHPMNPIVSDVRCSRPAGNLFEKKGKLFRPAQDSGKRYGHRIAVMEILQITESSYREKLAYFIEPNLVAGALGIHTINMCKGKMYLDFYFRK
ncbi:formyltransferase family protein [Algoriphagus sp.]|uniref:glucosamine inositolphosphorylceramide transferase family protein n=1 Tax=Algoriphagus sp. TaxID=1872435 RepID=UPI0025F7D414|nr:formyltransferase family protein [Algoriphagus sp.]